MNPKKLRALSREMKEEWMDVMVENKAEICVDLLKALQKTDAGKNIVDLIYTKSDNTNYEYVIIVWSNGTMKTVETYDDGMQMIRDITRVVYYARFTRKD